MATRWDYWAKGEIVINPSLYKLAYDTVKDFAPVSQVYRLTEHAGRT